MDEKFRRLLSWSPKIVILLDMIIRSVLNREKLLIFSQSKVTLSLIESIINSEHWGRIHFLSRETKNNLNVHFDQLDIFSNWMKSIHYFRIDGSIQSSKRQKMINSFNNTSKAHLFLLSTKAAGMGINLVAATRAIIFDTSWNPADDLQAIFRCYRYGQKKNVFVYRLLANGSMEAKIYKRQIVKSQLSSYVVDDIHPERAFEAKEMENLLTLHSEEEERIKLLEDLHEAISRSNDIDEEEDEEDYFDLQIPIEQLAPTIKKDPILGEIYSSHSSIISHIQEHDPLLEDKESEQLTETEEKEAQIELDEERERREHPERFAVVQNSMMPQDPNNPIVPLPPPDVPIPIVVGGERIPHDLSTFKMQPSNISGGSNNKIVQSQFNYNPPPPIHQMPQSQGRDGLVSVSNRFLSLPKQNPTSTSSSSSKQFPSTIRTVDMTSSSAMGKKKNIKTNSSKLPNQPQHQTSSSSSSSNLGLISNMNKEVKQSITQNPVAKTKYSPPQKLYKMKRTGPSTK